MLTKALVASVNPARIRRDLFWLSQDPLPCRTLNYTRPGQSRCTLHEADDKIISELASSGYEIETDVVPVQAFQPDQSTPWGFRKPKPDEPWYDATNIFGILNGSTNDRRLVLALAHKDSQSWVPRAPGAYDNASGTASLLEIARVLAGAQLDATVMLLFCNEEHWPWTSVHAAERISRAGFDSVSVLNIDSIGGKSQEDVAAGRHRAAVRYSTDAGEPMAHRIAELNNELQIGLDLSTHRDHPPNDDDGSFVYAGIPRSVLLIGSYPYADPNYHTVDDTPEKVDIENVTMATRLALATILDLATAPD